MRIIFGLLTTCKNDLCVCVCVCSSVLLTKKAEQFVDRAVKEKTPKTTTAAATSTQSH